jgi:hypothetical protein
MIGSAGPKVIPINPVINQRRANIHPVRSAHGPLIKRKKFIHNSPIAYNIESSSIQIATLDRRKERKIIECAMLLTGRKG